MLFLRVRGFSDCAGPIVHSRFTWLPYGLPPIRNEVGILIYGLFAAQLPRPPMPLSPLQETPRDVPCKTRGQDGFATSLPVGLLHPLQHAGLARRTPVCPLSRSFWRTIFTRRITRRGMDRFDHGPDISVFENQAPSVGLRSAEVHSNPASSPKTRSRGR